MLDRVDEAVARHVRREDEGLLAPAYALVVGLQAQHPARVDLQLVARLAVGDRRLAVGDRHGGGLAAKAELLDGEPVQRRVRHLNALACQQPKDLGQPQIILEVLLDERSLCFAGPPRIAVGMRGRLLERDDHRTDELVGQARKPVLEAHAAVLSLLHIAPYGLRIAPELRREALLRDPADPSS